MSGLEPEPRLYHLSLCSSSTDWTIWGPMGTFVMATFGSTKALQSWRCSALLVEMKFLVKCCSSLIPTSTKQTSSWADPYVSSSLLTGSRWSISLAQAIPLIWVVTSGRSGEAQDTRGHGMVFTSS